MCSDVVLRADNVRKVYRQYSSPFDRLKQFVRGDSHRYYREFVALEGLSFELSRGEVLGVIGCNGAGKSTLLQLICGTLEPTEGVVEVQGRIAALLELGAGFNPDFTGRENIYLTASVMGLTRAETDAAMDDIIEFSGIRPFIDQPVKTYSSGMYVRLAFSVATSVDPDILVIDEALSVGDGHFARKSFDRILEMRDQGKTILFCSHALYQLEELCSRVIWLDRGRVVESGEPHQVVVNYQSFLDRMIVEQAAAERAAARSAQGGAAVATAGGAMVTRLERVRVSVDGLEGKRLVAKNGESTLCIDVSFYGEDPAAPPAVAVVIHAASGMLVASSGSWNDGVATSVDADGRGQIRLEYPEIPLLRGEYHLDVILFCSKGVYIHDEVTSVATLSVTQSHAERGMVTLPHRWVSSEAGTGGADGQIAAPERAEVKG